MEIKQVDIKYDKNGKAYKSATLSAPVMGKTKFNIFPRHTRYNDVGEGAEFSSEDFAKEGDYINLIDPDQGIKKGIGGRQNFNVAAAQEHKKEAIKEAQDNKNDAIKTSSTFRDATAITVAMMTEDKLLDWHVTWSENRQWLLNHWEPEVY